MFLFFVSDLFRILFSIDQIFLGFALHALKHVSKYVCLACLITFALPNWEEIAALKFFFTMYREMWWE